MKCSQCGHTNPKDGRFCQQCGNSLGDDSEKTGIKPQESLSGAVDSERDSAAEESPTGYRSSREEDSPTGWRLSQTGVTGVSAGSLTPSGGRTPPPASAGGELSSYQSFGNRFEILELLGEGGMGKVYKAWDRELEKIVALKTLRGEQATSSEMLKRFKQELLLARQITHKNVIRIHDMGEFEGVKFFTMEFIVGDSLKDVVRKKGKLSSEQSLSIAKQILGALAEAHGQGVIHRDLKPHNIMVDPDGVAHVMDFGIARSVQDTGGMTATGTVMGTPDYMSPEQARGEKAEAPSDLFSFGVILYEMLGGDLPYSGDTMASKVLARLTQKPRPIREIVPDIPKLLENIVHKCLETDLAMRYKSAREILEDIEREQVDRSLSLRVRRAVVRRKAGVAAAAVTSAAIAVAVYFAVGRGKVDVGAIAPATTLAIVPFANATTDPSLDWLGASLAEILTTEVGQSEKLRTVTGDRVNQILDAMRVKPGSRIDPTMLARVAEFSKADAIVSGQYLKLGNRIRIDATVQDLKGDRKVTLKAEAADENALLESIRGLAKDVQANLGLSGEVVKELQATSFRPSSDSIQALRFYNEGELLARGGSQLEALKRFEEATQEDPEFALAWAALGQTYANLGYDYEAEEHLRTAVELSEALPQQERYQIIAIQARNQKDYDRAIQAYENLAKAMPADSEVQFRLGQLYQDKGDFARASELYRKVLERDPNDLAALLAMGHAEVRQGDPQRAFEPLNSALSLSIQLGNQEARGNALFGLALAYGRLSQREEALRHFQDALASRTEAGDKRGTAECLKEIARLDWTAGNVDAAQATYEKALELQKEIGDRLGTARVLMTLGEIHYRRAEYAEALDLYRESLSLVRGLGDKYQEGICLNYMGTLYLDDGQYGDAQTYLELARRVWEERGAKRELSETVHNLGELALRTGRYNAAIDSYLRSLELSRDSGDDLGVAAESYSLGMVFGYQGRLGASLKAMEDAVQSLQKAQEGGYWKTAILAGYGDALNRMGRFEEGKKALDEALALARELDVPTVVAQTLNFIGEGHFYQGTPGASRGPLEESLRVASTQNDRSLILPSRVNLARLAAEEAKDPSSIGSRVKTLEELAKETDALGLKYYSAACSIAAGEALLRSQSYDAARSALEDSLREAVRSGLRILMAEARFLLGEASRLEGNEADARRHYREAARVLDEVKSEAGGEGVFQRADLKRIHEESARWSSSPTN